MEPFFFIICVICISAKATMQTFPCGHRVVCRKCFVKTIQVAVSQRLLPLRCVICRAKILRLKQTSQGGIDTGTVLRNHVSAVGGHHHHHHHHSRSSLVTSPSPSSSSSSTTGSINSPLGNNPFFISPITSPVSPVTEVFREQRAVWARNYDSFGYEVTGQSPISAASSPIVSTPTVSSESSLFKTDLNLGSGCVLHKHCICKHSINGNDDETNSSGTSSCSTRNLSAKICSPSTSSSPSSSKSPSIISGFLQSSFAASSSNTSVSSPLLSSSYTDQPHQPDSSTLVTSPSPSSSSPSSSFTPICPTAPNPWQFQINRKRRHRLAHRRRRGHYVPSGRPTSLLLPIDEKDEWHEESCTDEMVAHKSSSSMAGFAPSFLTSYNYRSKRKQLKEKLSSSRNGDNGEEEDENKETEKLGATGHKEVNDENDYHYSDDEVSSEEEEEDDEGEEEETENNDVGLMYEETSLDEEKNDSRRDSVKFLLDTSQTRSSIPSSSPINHFTSSSRLSNAFMKAKNLVSKGKWRNH
uniref:RING-type domain-containing protein n=1 Tax=Tetranychus urticae TaxID=32264 RepID=T1K179_TETUR